MKEIDSKGGEGLPESGQEETETVKYISFRVPLQKFKEIKVESVMKGMSLGDYIISLHDAARSSRGS